MTDTPDTLAKSDDFVSLPRAEVEALMEAAEAQVKLFRVFRPHGIASEQVDAMLCKALATLQERMK